MIPYSYSSAEFEMLKVDCREGNSDAVRQYLKFHSASTELLCLAAWHGQLEIAKLLVAADADVNATTEHEESILYWASNAPHLAVIKVLVDAGLTLSQCITPKLVSYAPDPRVFEYLLSHGASFSVADAEIAEAALMAHHFEALQCFVTHGMRVTQKQLDFVDPYLHDRTASQLETVELIRAQLQVQTVLYQAGITRKDMARYMTSETVQRLKHVLSSLDATEIKTLVNATSSKTRKI